MLVARRARLARLDPGPERHGAVEDVPGEDLLDLQIEIGLVGELERGKQRRDGAAVGTHLQGHLGLDDHGAAVVQRPGVAVCEQAVGGEEARQRTVDAEPLLCLRHVEADLPAHRLCPLREDLAPAHQERTRALLDAHGLITILSASRRS